MKREMRWILFALMLVLVSCSSPTPTPSPTPTATSTPVPSTPGPLERAVALAGRIADALASETNIRIEKRAERMALSLGDEAVGLMCLIADGAFEPELELADLTDSMTLRTGIKAFCVRPVYMHWSRP